MDAASKRRPSNEVDHEHFGTSLSAVRTNDSSTSGSGSKLPHPRMNSRVGSTHSLLAKTSGGAETRRSAQSLVDTSRTSMDRASISMPPPSSKPAVERRLSASLSSSIMAANFRKSDDLGRSPPSSIRSMEERQLPASAPFSTTATDTTPVTATSVHPPLHGTPMLSPPPISPEVLDMNSGMAPQMLSPISEPQKELMAAVVGSDKVANDAYLSRPRKPRSASSSRRISTAGSRTDDAASDVVSMGKIGVCALDVKARSRPSRQILTRLQGNGEFEVIVFGDKVILDEAVENWPICDFLISFFSDGFPLDKAIAYAKMRKPFLVNDLMMQKVLWDRRLCLKILDHFKVPTPQRLEVNRDGGPKLESPELAQHVKKLSGVSLSGPEDGTGGGTPMTKEAYMADDDTLIVDGKVFKKPFVEKPVSGEDHNVIIYFPRSQDGGGARRLFRKIGNKSSELDPELIIPRCITEEGSSYLYEQFLRVENAEDVKAYTVGDSYCHAETRKSPVVDGLVRRNTHGKELRYVTKLSEEERRIAAKVAHGFGQRICGFDLLRSGNGSYVIDVNGWSFVKDNEAYYNECSRILRDMFFRIKFSSDFGLKTSSPGETPPDSSHRKDTQPFSTRQALKTILKSPSMSKISQHIAHPRHHNSISGAMSPKIGVPISSPPSMEVTKDGVERGSIIERSDETSPPSHVPGVASPVNMTDSPLPASVVEEAAIPAAPLPSSKHSWKLKGVVTVIRHADRTPKQKIKFTAHSSVFVDLLKGHHEEVLLKGSAALASVENAVRIAIQQKLEDPDKLRNLRNALIRKGDQPGTKVQIKPMFRKRKHDEMRPTSQGTPLPMQIPEDEPVPSVPSPAPEAPSNPASPGEGDAAVRVPTRSDSITDATFSRFAAAENDLVLDKLQLVMKWGGEPTHSARYQSQDLGTNMRDDYKLMNREVLNDVRIFTSSEKRVKTSAQIFAAAFLNRQDLPEDYISVRKDLLDDSNAAKDVMDKVKKKLKHLLREGNSVPEEFAWPKDVPEPFIVMQTVIDLLKFHRKVMRYNFKKLSGSAATSLAAIGTSDAKDDKQVDVSSIQARWCTGEDAELFKERWEKLFSEFCDTEKADPSKVSELYDTMKYDALHNKQFLEWVFTPHQGVLDEIAKEEGLSNTTPAGDSSEDPAPGVERSETGMSAVTDKQSFAAKLGIRRRSVLAQPPATPPLTSYEQDASYFKLFSGSGDSRSKQDKRLGRLRELYRYSKILFDYIGPQEYGISDNERLEIGLLTSLPLLREIVQDLEELQATGDAKSFVYFTKESHIYTLLNCIMEGGIHTKIKRATIPELDYLSQICFELYEAHDPDKEESTYSIRISISPGCHTIDPLDVSLDSKHAIGSAARRSLTNHQDWKEVISTLKAKFNTVQLPKSFLAVNVSDKHEQEARQQQAQEEAYAAKYLRDVHVGMETEAGDQMTQSPDRIEGEQNLPGSAVDAGQKVEQNLL